MKLNTFSNLNNTFYINKLCLTNNNPLLNQFMNDTQPPPIQKNEMEGYIVKNIIIKKKRKVEKRSKKKYKIK